MIWYKFHQNLKRYTRHTKDNPKEVLSRLYYILCFFSLLKRTVTDHIHGCISTSVHVAQNHTILPSAEHYDFYVFINFIMVTST